MKTLLDKTREINKIIQKAAGHPISFADMAKTLCENMNTNVYIIDSTCRMLGYAFIDGFHCPAMEEIATKTEQYPLQSNEELLKSTEARINIDRGGACAFGVYDKCLLEGKLTTTVPIMGGGDRLGTLVLSKSGEFDSGDQILAELSATVIGMEMMRARLEKLSEIARQRAMVALALESLSYTEQDAVQHIFDELGKDGGLLVTSKVADQHGITRSVIVNALRKLESAGIVEVRSMGMNGTNIRIVNSTLGEELEKLKKAEN